MSTEALSLSSGGMLKHTFTIATYTFFAVFALLALFMVGTFLPDSVGYHVRVVQTGSMEPTIPVGAVVVVRPAAHYGVDDVITFQRLGEEEATTHRIVKDEVIEGSIKYTVQGDANNAPDTAPVAVNEIRGKVLFSVPYLGFVLDFIQQPIGFILIIGIPAVAIVAEEVLKIMRTIRNSNEEKVSKESEKI